MPRVQRDIHELFTRSAGDLLDHWFETDAVKALYGFDAVVGSYASPYTPGSAYVLLHHVFGEVNGKTGVWGHAVGGMGAITQAMATEARRLGVTLETDAPVKRIIVERGRATGIELEDGRVIQGNAVAANLGPKPLFLKLLADAELPAEFRARIERLRVGSATFRMNVALSELPKFIAAPRDDGGAHLGSGIILAPSLEYMDHAFADARLTGMSRKPIVEMLIPSTLDTSLAPKGAHVASLFCQHFSYKLPDGRDWRQEKPRATDLIFVDGGIVRAELSREHPRSFVTEPARSRRKTRPSWRRYFPRSVGPRSIVGRATDVRLRRLPHTAEKPVLVRFRCTSRWRRDRTSRSQRRARNNARWC